MKKVYAVVSGAYSDYRVLCVCPTKDVASLLASRIRRDEDSWYRDVGVEEMVFVDDGNIPQVRTLRLSENVWDSTPIQGTSTSDYQEHVSTDWPFDSYTDTPRVAWQWVRAPIHQNAGGRLYVWGTDHEAVRRVFSDRRAQLLAEDAFRLKKEAKGRK